MTKKCWWIIGGALGAAGLGVLLTQARLATEAPESTHAAATGTERVKDALVCKISTLLGQDKQIEAQLVVDATDGNDLEHTVREVFANIEHDMLMHGYDVLWVIARSEDGRHVVEATNEDGPLSVLQIPVPEEEVEELLDLPVEALRTHVDAFLLGN